MTADEAVACLQKAAEAETMRGLAKRLGISSGYLCHILKGRKKPEHVLKRFGFERIVFYRRKQPASDEVAEQVRSGAAASEHPN